MLPVPRPRAEIPLADAINKDVAQFLSSPDDEPVKTTMPPLMSPLNCLPSSPLSQRSSRMPTSSSSEGWEYLPLNAWKDCGYSQAVLDDFEASGRMSEIRTDGHPNVVCYTIYSDDDTMQAVQRAPETLQIPPKAPPQPKAPAEAPPTSARLQPKAPPKPPFNLYPPPPKAAKPSKAAPPPKAAPESMGPPPPVMPPMKSPPNTRPLKSWKKKAPTVINCQRCGHGTKLTQFM